MQDDTDRDGLEARKVRGIIARAMNEAGIAGAVNERDGRLTWNSRVVLDRRYLRKDDDGTVIEEPDTMFRRVSINLSGAELNYGATEEERRDVEEMFYLGMTRLEFLPNSPTLMNAGRELQQLSACFVLPVDDSLDSIFESTKQTALIHKSGGGTGFSFSRLRPEGDRVGTTGGVASGPVSFIRVFDAATDVVKQGGTRRGANMAILDVTHPDILRFINEKRNPDRLTNFNVSVAVNRDFMERVRRGQEYELFNPRTQKVTGRLNAREVFDQIIDCAWETGDPGLVFMDRINDGNPNPHLGMIESTNPCVTGETWVATDTGPRRVTELLGRQATLLVDGQPCPTGPEGFFSTGRKPVIRIETQDGRHIRLTADHLLAKLTPRPQRGDMIREWTPAGEVRPGDLLSLHEHGSDQEDSDAIIGSIKRTAGTVTSLRQSFSRENTVISLRSNDNPEVQLRDLPAERLEEIQQQLSYMGIRSRTAITANGDQELTVETRELERLAMRVGSNDKNEQAYLSNLAQIATENLERGPQGQPKTRVIAVHDDGREEVYDVQVPGVNAFDANGFYAHNCGEQPLLPYESCNLGSINLARMLTYTEDDVRIDWVRLGETCKLAVRMLDNVIDVNEFPIPEIGEMSRTTRRIGVGVMGWADMLIQLAIRYDSDEAFQLAREIMEFIRAEVHRHSAELATWRGPYPAWEGSRYDCQGTEGVPGWPAEPVQMRNSAPVTIAPTGTISIIAGASSGIEPLFALSYERNVMDGTRLIEVNPHLEAVARHAGFYSEELMAEVARTGTLEGTDAPRWAKDIFRSSTDISPAHHVCMQAAFQAHTDNSVSKTINLPAEATREDVQDAYVMAYETNCKGITVYRDGSRAEQVLSTAETYAGDRNGGHPHPHPTPRPRPREMAGSTVLVRTGHGNMYVTINRDQEGYPFELFTQVGKAGGCDSAMLEAISRLISMGLRAGLEPGEITGQLRGITCCPAWDEGVLVRSIPDGVAHALSVNIGEDTGAAATAERENSGSMRCPDCNAPAVFTEGCESCSDPSCGWNRCD